MKRPKNALVLGIGNILLKDEGLGVRAIEFFSRNYSFANNVKCIDGGVMGVGLLPLIKGFDMVIIVDAICSDAPAGRIFRFSGKAIEKAVPDGLGSAHSIGASELLGVMRFEGIAPEVAILAMVPSEIKAGLSLSPLIEERVPLLAGKIALELRRMGIPVKRKRP